MKIKKATIDDFEKLKKIKILSKKEELKYSDSLKPIEKTKKKFLEYMRHNLQSRYKSVFYAEEDDKVIGYVLVQWFTALPIVKFKRKGYVSNLYIDIKYRKKGIGIKLVKKAMEWLKKNEVKHVSLEIHVDNKAAQNLYKKLGFKEYTLKLSKII